MRIVSVVLLLSAGSAAALEPAEIIVVANRNVPASRGVAEYYLKARNVPADNLIVLDLPAAEQMPRADYEPRLAAPLREKLRSRKQAIKLILTVHGVPLRIGRTIPTDREQAELKEVVGPLKAARDRVAELSKTTPPDAQALAAARAEVSRLAAREARLAHHETEAAIDSELMLLWAEPYAHARFRPNPLHWRFTGKLDPDRPVLMTCRLDGSTPEIAKRLVDDALATEAAGGLTGKAYIDARGIGYDPNKPGESGAGYEGYDESFREMATHLTAAGIKVVLDDKEDLFPAAAYPDAALYAGWYALTNYRKCVTPNRGAVAWHLASGELNTLKPGTTCWCANLLKDGAAVTLGPVSEPYTLGFPKPAEFFGFLITGEYTVAEVYARTQYLTSWMVCLIGDPLYNPYKQSKPGKIADVVPSPRGAPELFRPQNPTRN